MPENLISRDVFSRPVPRQPAHFHTQAGSDACLRDSSRVPRRRPCIYFKRPYTVPSLSGHAIAYRWCSLPRVRRHRASEPQGSSERVLPWQVTMDQLIYVSFSPSVFLFRCVLHPLPLSSCLGCIPPLIGLPSLRFYAVGSSLFLLSVCFCLCFLFYRDDVLCWLLPCPSFYVCFPCLSPIPCLIWFGSVYLVTTAGFVADQLM